VNGFWFGQCLDVSGVVGFLVFWYMNHRSSCTNFHFIPTWPGTIVRQCIITKTTTMRLLDHYPSLL
jgi:hypothetical protein